jgi:hypothetical protein
VPHGRAYKRTRRGLSNEERHRAGREPGVRCDRGTRLRAPRGHGSQPAMDDDLRGALEADVRMTQERFCVAMEGRLSSIEPDSLERYFAVLSKLVLKLEDPGKSLGQIMNEMMAETASVIMQEMQSRR